ncbi:hypothetical protein GALMADRAFT_1247027 [Galerina marginata CBS 339.88]|uniref:Uncharacterized protein n=1 Tax=Galerina marginata (strain CBS 339.88) TaxID=685588 RepID=A0A067T936_GALM3|nr:hypothetical protein GALMADRAFT_1247027 [Galerina marginata CBS 339.88]
MTIRLFSPALLPLLQDPRTCQSRIGRKNQRLGTSLLSLPSPPQDPHFLAVFWLQTREMTVFHAYFAPHSPSCGPCLATPAFCNGKEGFSRAASSCNPGSIHRPTSQLPPRPPSLSPAMHARLYHHDARSPRRFVVWLRASRWNCTVMICPRLIIATTFRSSHP